MIRFCSAISKHVLFCMTTCFITIPTYAQDSPVDIQLYLFAMDKVEIRQILKDGVTRDELDALQTNIYLSNRLLEEEEPLTLSIGENHVSIPAEKLSALTGGNTTSTILFFFEVVPAEGSESAQSGFLKRNSYIINEKDEKVLIRKSSWEYQSERGTYRYFDFRFANVLGHKEFVYELTAEVGEEPVLYTISIK